MGANIGYHTLVMAAAVGRSGRVAAFEPNPAAAERLRRNVVLNGFSDRVSLHAEAAGAHEGEAVTLQYDPEFLGGGYVGGAPVQGLRRVPVTSRRLDDAPEAAAFEVVKIDAEGSEAAVWAGMSGLLAGPRLRTVVLEWTGANHPDPLAALGGFAQAGFGLGLLDTQDGVRPVDAATVLALPAGRPRMLVLRR